jgi:uncharacterized protein YeaC (DUF1315 family)
MYGPERICGTVYFDSTVTMAELGKEPEGRALTARQRTLIAF